MRTKLGLKVVDERITISHDPADPALGVIPYAGTYLEPFQPVKWIDRGVLMALSDNSRDLMLGNRNDNIGAHNSGAFRMSGGETSVEEMIKSTKRGLLVTRFSNVRVLDPSSVLSTGLTRDGLWLIENGQITKAVKNLRFTESPLFVLNSLEQLGVPVPVFRPVKNAYFPMLTPAIVPPLKARDFSFTSTIDAI
jgi:predicted Zn-dependent protease